MLWGPTLGPDVESCGEIVGTIFGLILGLSWAILGYVLAFILDLGISVSLSFGSMQGVCNKYRKHKEKQHVLAVLLMFLMLCLTMFARYFSGVAVAFEWYFWWCISCWWVSWWCVAWHVVSSHNMGRYFNGVLHLRTDTTHINPQISNNPAHLWPMTSPALFLS